MPSVFISILNWNGAASTLQCVSAVRQSVVPNNIVPTLIVLDNGSVPSDLEALRHGLANTDVFLIRQEVNAGFSAGHNVIIRRAIEQKADFIWLLNNDALVKPDTLAALLNTISESPDCGAVSPLIYAHHDGQTVDFIGAFHDWRKLDLGKPNDLAKSKTMQIDHSKDFFIFGTAPLFRIAVFCAIGLLDEGMFAYYEDDDIGARLSNAGWSSKMAFSTSIQHFRRKSVSDERPPYYFYLMARNSLLFYLRHTPTEFRRWIRLRLFSRAMISAANLRARGFTDKSNACLLGILDGLLGRSGPPQINISPPTWLIWASSVFPYRLQQWLDRDLP